jgi:beta-lactamase regulating signal transducer with metallopeptidase domain/DUF4097 and DUF4098 domain-containing protein YvlB
MSPTPIPATLTETQAMMVTVVAGATVLLAGAALITALARRASSATRHFIWLLALSGSLAIAIAAPFLPALSLRVPLVATAAHESSGPATSGFAPRSVVNLLQGIPAPKPDQSTHAAAHAVAAPAAVPSLSRFAGAIWILGAVLLGLWFALGHLALARLARAARPVLDPVWLETLREESGRMGWRSQVRLLSTPRVGSPLTWRARALVVLLPDDPTSWSASKRSAVLAHELAHALRGDHQANLLANLACAVLWFHPLVWYAARRLRSESERACDDIVLAGGASNADYASLLLEVALTSRALRLAGVAAIGMARPSQLEGRLLAVLDGKRIRTAPSRRALAFAWTGLAAIALTLAAVRPAAMVREEALAGGSDSGGGAKTLEYAVAASPGQRLELDLETGGSVKITGWNESRVLVRANLSGRDWSNTRVALERVTGGARLHSWQEPERDNSSTSHRFEIQVPKKFDVKLSSAGGGLEISQVEGEFRGNTGGGEIEIDHAKGRASLSTGGGSIHVSDSDLSGSVSTGGGEVLLSGVSGGLRGTSGSGPVIYGEDGSGRTAKLGEVSVDGGTITGRPTMDKAGVLHVTRAGGEVDLDEAPHGAVVSTGGGDVRIGASDGKLDVSTGGGDIEVGPARGSVRAHTGAGRVQITVVSGSSPEHSLEILSGTGAAIVELPADLSARFDLETAYTNNRDAGRTKIVSDFPLQITETSKWDDSEGTARKYVRASGTAGKGEGRIFIKIVNGDITIRKGKSGKP